MNNDNLMCFKNVYIIVSMMQINILRFIEVKNIFLEEKNLGYLWLNYTILRTFFFSKKQ